MRVQRTYNQALLNTVALEPQIWERISEDDEVTPDEYEVDMDAIHVYALLDDKLHGFVLMRPITDTVAEAHVMVHPDHWGDKRNVELARMAVLKGMVDMKCDKLVAAVPVPDKETLRFAQRVGFKREGINKASFRRGGELIDQYYLGFTRN